ncbi:MAG: glycosyltransferase family 1 protein [Planctomycetota bacterium]|nr:glycosyltransferase family 1 protein [Planctomycetota bacterium]
MRVAIDGLHLFGNYAGIQGSLARLVQALRSTFPQDELVLYVPRDFKGPPAPTGDSGLLVRRTWFPGRWRTIRTLWRNMRLQSRTYADNCDLLHGPTYALPGFVSKPAVVTIHDVIALTHPLFCTPGSARLQQRLIPRSVAAARRVIVPSLASKEELLRQVKGAVADHIDVVPWGVGEEFKPIRSLKPLSDAGLEEARAALNLPPHYVLFVGNIEPKKNIPALIQAFFAAKMNRKLPHKLVLTGQMGWKMHGLERLIRTHKATDFVLFTGYVPQRVLPALYSLADLFVMPSVVEGFGMPTLEAMACGCPVVVSSDAALREVCGNAARVVPYDPVKPLQPLREAIEELLTGPSSAREELTKLGLARAREFTWEKTARLTRATYERALAQ